MTQKRRKQRVLTAFVASYSLMLLIPLIMGIVVFVMASCIIRNDTLNTCARYLDYAVQTIDDAYETAQNLTLSISSSRDYVRKLDEMQPENKYAILELTGASAVLRTSNNLFNRYFLYYHGNDIRLVIYKRGCYSLRFSFKMKVIG